MPQSFPITDLPLTCPISSNKVEYCCPFSLPPHFSIHYGNLYENITAVVNLCNKRTRWSEMKMKLSNMLITLIRRCVEQNFEQGILSFENGEMTKSKGQMMKSK